MSATVNFKCPGCGGYLEFDPSGQRFKCLYCGQVLSEDELREQSAQREAEAETRMEESSAENAGETSAQGGNLRSYHCQMCGAEIVTDETTAATRCYYCHNPVVLHDRLDDEFRPDGVIPFQMTREEAETKFREYVKKKRFIDKAFFDEGQLEMFSGVYYPFWYCDVDGTADFSGEGVRTSMTTTPTHYVTTRRYFRVERQARMSFRNLARKALSKVDGKLADGIHPFNPEGVVPYASGYLSGFLAEKRDLSGDTAVQDMLEEVKGYVPSMIKRGHTFNSLSGSTSFRADKVESRYVLLPTWVLTYKGGKDGAPFYYMMNGQTGRVCGKLPVDRKKLLLTALAAGAAVFAALCLGGMLIW